MSTLLRGRHIDDSIHIGKERYNFFFLCYDQASVREGKARPRARDFCSSCGRRMLKSVQRYWHTAAADICEPLFISVIKASAREGKNTPESKRFSDDVASGVPSNRRNAKSPPKEFWRGEREHDLWGGGAAGFDAGTLHMCKVSRTLPCGDDTQEIVYILSSRRRRGYMRTSFYKCHKGKRPRGQKYAREQEIFVRVADGGGADNSIHIVRER